MRNSEFINPFYRIAGFKSFSIGLIGLLATSYIAFISGTHFNGLLSIQFAKDSDYWVFLVENVAIWLFISVFMYLLGLVLSKSKIRLIDVFGTTLLSRIPLILAPAVRLFHPFITFGFLSWQMYFVNGVYFISLVWSVVLLYNAYRVSCNLKNERLVVSFLVALILAEICVRIFIFKLI